MDGHQQPPSLGTCADECVDQLQIFKKDAQRFQRSRTSTTKKLLGGIINDVNSSLDSLRTWKKDLSDGTLTDKLSVVKAVELNFESLHHSITVAHESLRKRLRYRRLYLIGYDSEKKLTRALNSVHTTIEWLQAQTKILLVRPGLQADVQSRQRDVREGTNQPYNAFSDFFGKYEGDDQDTFRSSAFRMLWARFPPLSDKLKGKIGSAEDPGDGFLYGPQLEKATSILKDFHQAWSNLGGRTACPPPTELPNMALICLILTGMQQQQMLGDFLAHKIVDADLPLLRYEIEQVLRAENSKYASTFYTEQSRAVPRRWDEGCHLEIEEEEPLPLMNIKECNQGSYGVVIMVQDPLSLEFYARKQQLTGGEAQEDAAAQNHLREEAARLRNLRHKHVVQLVKSYQRGRTYGIILKPAATGDLERLIPRYYDNKWDTMQDRKTREWLHPIFLQVFGCLSKGLAYIHSQNIRHKDVKPANILYEKAINNNGPRLLWADFGLAYDFSATGNSKTKSTKLYSQRYAAPEIVAASTQHGFDRKAAVQPDLSRITEDGEELMADAPIESAFRETEETGHGRKTDIFSLGCVFLEILACLLDDRLPMDQKDANNAREAANNAREAAINLRHLPREVQMFSQHIPKLIDWAHEKLVMNHELSPMLRLAVKMIAPKPEARPVIEDVIKAVALAGDRYFCGPCWQEDQSQYHPTAGSTGVSPPNAASTPGSPGKLSEARLERVNSAPRRASVSQILVRVNSATPPQLKRLFSKDKG